MAVSTPSQQNSILSPRMRQLVMNRTTVDASAIRNDILSVEQKRNLVDVQTANTISNQEQTLLKFNDNIIKLRDDILKLGIGLDKIANLLVKDSVDEQNRIRSEIEQKRLEAERISRTAKEDQVEQKIRSSLVRPVEKITPKLNDIFSRVRNALAILFGGWLTYQNSELIKAEQEGNVEKIDAIKRNIVKNIGIIFGGLFAIRRGFQLFKRLISNLGTRLLNLMIVKPIRAAGRFLGSILNPRRPSTQVKPPRSSPRGSPSVGGISKSIIGSIGRALTAFMNFKNDEHADALLGIISIVGPGKFVRIASGLAYTADQIAEIFGGNIFSRDPNKKRVADEVIEETKNIKSSDNELQIDSQVQSEPLSTISGESIDQETSSPESSSNIGDNLSMPLDGIDKNVSENKNQSNSNNFSPKSISMPAETMTGESSSISLDGDVEKKADAISPESIKEQQSKIQISSKDISPSSQTPMRVGSLPEPAPTLKVVKTAMQSQEPKDGPPLSDGPLTDVPLINSSNPDNFYILYSQLNYNVIV